MTHGHVPTRRATLGLAIIGVTLLAVPGFPAILRSALRLPLRARVSLSVPLIDPVGFVLGMPFAIGLSILAKRSEVTTPWTWAANGDANGVGVFLAPLVAAETGFRLSIVIACAIYMGGLLALELSIRAPALRQIGTPSAIMDSGHPARAPALPTLSPTQCPSAPGYSHPRAMLPSPMDPEPFKYRELMSLYVPARIVVRPRIAPEVHCVTRVALRASDGRTPRHESE